MNKLELIKTIGGAIVSVGVGAIVKNAVDATTPSTTKGLKKLVIGIGALVLGGIITDKAISYTEEKIDKTVTGISNMVKNETTETKEA